MAALRDTARNPEWASVEEGPLWWGRRVASWGELFERCQPCMPALHSGMSSQ